jgi:hypothetical protein
MGLIAPLMDRSSPRAPHYPRSVRPTAVFGSRSFIDEMAVQQDRSHRVPAEIHQAPA